MQQIFLKLRLFSLAHNLWNLLYSATTVSNQMPFLQTSPLLSGILHPDSDIYLRPDFPNFAPQLAAIINRNQAAHPYHEEHPPTHPKYDISSTALPKEDS
jgi:hypothetical protein